MEILYKVLDGLTGGNSRADARLQRFLVAVSRYCRETGGSVTSWIRTEKRNKKVGGAPRSHHLKGLACDITYDEHLPKTVRAEAAERYGLYLIHEKSHDHCSIDGH